MIASGAADWQLDALGVTWYLDYTTDPRTAPPGSRKVLFVPMSPDTPLISQEQISEFASAVPGSVWYLGGEPNVPQQGGISPAAYLEQFDYYEKQIRQADPTAKITSPSILNWDFTCRGCGGYRTGNSWLREFVQLYQDAHDGQSPPVDIWALDSYPLTWDAVPMVEWSIITDQIIGLRHFLQSDVPGHRDTPIWLTELASHWAYTAWATTPSGSLTLPEGMDFQSDYRWNDMHSYMTELFDWLSARGPDFNVERWFLFITYVDLEQQALEDGYAGIYLFEHGGAGAPLNSLGSLYREYATGAR